ncbi:ABC transporter substrate-binding protein [Reinekea forsetii]|nr:ABC transporter substrate-binding protein [Reinekea forsetii]
MKQPLLVCAMLVWGAGLALADEGVFANQIIVGGVMDLEGQSRGLGQGMKTGIEAAFRGVSVQGRRLNFKVLNDSYTPSLTGQQTQRLIDEDVFAVIGNVGTPTAQVSLPLLAKARIPAVGFFTGAGLLRPGVGDVINFRASYVQEAAAVIDAAITAGVRPQEICAYVQNDAYGMAGVSGIKAALQSRPNTRDIVARIDQILALDGDNPERNYLGPVGVYQRNTLSSRDGYDSLKAWENQIGTRCKLVVTVGTYAAIGRFAGYARYQGEDWVISAVSFTGAENLSDILTEFGVIDRVVMTQVVPELDSNLAIVKQAMNALGDDFNFVTFEGYLVGRMFIEILRVLPGEPNRRSFLSAARNARFDLGGLVLEFIGDNQGSDLVTTTYYSNKEYRPMTTSNWLTLF